MHSVQQRAAYQQAEAQPASSAPGEPPAATEPASAELAALRALRLAQRDAEEGLDETRYEGTTRPQGTGKYSGC